MSVFTDEDNQTLKNLAMTFAGFTGLTVALILLAMVIVG